MTYILFVLGFVILIKGADVLVDGASAIARRLNVSDLVIGLTVVAFGTSTPELFVNLVASFKGNTAIAVGNVLGSNIANVFLILGVSALIFPLAVSSGTVWKEIPFSLLAAIVVGLMANDRLIDQNNLAALTRIDGLLLLCFFIIFLYYSVYSVGIAKDVEGLGEHVTVKPMGALKSSILIISGLIALSVGAKWIVDGAVSIATQFGLSQSIIGLTIVAVGTSLPELATSAVAAFKKNADIAVGNVVGSNIFNIFFVLGISATIRPLPFQTRNNLDVGIMVLASLLLFVFMFSGKKRSLDRWEGAIFLVLYAAFVTYLILMESG